MNKDIDQKLNNPFPPSISNKKHRLCLYLMLDGGLTPREISTLKSADCNLKKKLLYISGKKDKTIHLSKPLYRALQDYLKHTPLKGEFLLSSKKGPLTIRAIEKIRSKISIDYPNPKNTSPIPTQPTNIENQLNNQDQNNSSPSTIGRQPELAQINDLINKGCNVLLLGPIGIGKSHLIKQTIQNSQKSHTKVLYLDDCQEIKQSLIECLVYLHDNDKKHVQNLLQSPYDLEALQQHLQRSSVVKLTQEIIKITTKKEYLLVIDQVDTMTPKAIKTIETLKDHFTILTSARQIPIQKSSFIWNFQIIPIKKLNKENSIALIEKLSHRIPIKDKTTYTNHIYRQSDGNPRIITELVDRFQKEGTTITDQTIQKINHIGNNKEYDLSIIIVIILAGTAALRYIANQIGEPRLRIIGSIALLILIIYKYFFSKNGKNKYYK